MSAGGAEAREYLREQIEFTKLQKQKPIDQNAFELSHLRWRRAVRRDRQSRDRAAPVSLRLSPTRPASARRTPQMRSRSKGKSPTVFAMENPIWADRARAKRRAPTPQR
jgi:hypothetical protein